MRHELDEPGILLEDQRASRLAFGIAARAAEHRGPGALLDLLRRRRRAPGLHQRGRARDRERPELRRRPRSCEPRHHLHPRSRRAAGRGRAARLRPPGGDPPRDLPRPRRRPAPRPGAVRAGRGREHRPACRSLPQIASEGGGQGLTLLAALQDLSQARARWGKAADGFLTLFGTKLILPGIADTTTLEAVSTMLGEYDRQVISRSQRRQPVQRPAARRPGRSPPSAPACSRPARSPDIPAGRATAPRRHQLGARSRSRRAPRRAVAHAHHPPVMSATEHSLLIGLPRRFAGGTSWDVLGRLAPSAPSAWSVCLLPLGLER